MPFDQDAEGRVESQADGDPRASDSTASDEPEIVAQSGEVLPVDVGPGTDNAVEAPEPTAGTGRGQAAAAEAAELRDKYLRLAAEFENYRKRAARERLEAGARAQADLVKQLIDGLDDLSRFAHVDPASIDPATLTHGVDLVERKLLKALNAAGLEVVNPIDQAFDPKLHEAVATERALSPEDDHVVARVYQPGYVFNGQLLRPARVVVKQWNG
jgi:molecular chaperone GrpE